MLSRLVCTFTPLAIALSVISPQPNLDVRQTVGRISANVMHGAAIELLRQLTDDIGARVAGC